MRQIAVRLLVAGTVAQVAGLAVDGWLHGRDPGLAARESVFSLTNPGHALVALGLALALTGSAVLVAGPRLERAGRRRSIFVIGGTVAAAVVASASAAVAVETSARGHEDSHDRASAAVTTANETSAAAHAHGRAAGQADTEHGEGPSLPTLTVDEAATLDVQLADARAVVARYPHLADALADGFILGAPYERLIGSHYLRYADIDGSFDPRRPEMLLYAGDTPDSPIVGLTYYVIAAHAPDGFAGRADHWHQHTQTCITEDGPVFGGDGYKRCKASGRLAWMLHAWVVPGMESPQGVFSAENIRLR